MGHSPHRAGSDVSGPLDIVLYPFLDVNLAKGVHGVVNGVLFPVAQMPIVTAERCRRGGGALMLCLPDFEPGFNMFVVGLRSLGQMLDNWLDVASIIVQSSLGFDPGLRCDQLALAITPLNASTDLFGSNQTAVVGLTEGLYAVTDGWSAQYFDHYDSVSSLLAPGVWPLRVDPSLGVAAVTFLSSGGSGGQRDSVGNPSTTMLGCRCDDVDGEMRIRCGLALYESAGEGGRGVSDELDRVFDVVFQQRSTAGQMTCAEAEISVQSVRWPVRRFVEPLRNEADMDETCTGRGTCTSVDAAIWVQPRCMTAKGANQRICREGNNLASCFPYCMAARRAGSAADGLVLYSASEWRNKVHLYERDCAYGYMADPSSSAALGLARYEAAGAEDGSGGSRVDASVVTLNDVLGGSVRINEWDPSVGGCRRSAAAVSRVGVDAMPSYAGGRWPSIALPGQPFSFAGDTALTTVRAADGSYSIRVDRLFGDQSNEFTIVNVLKDFPTEPPGETKWMEAQDTEQGDAVRVPYAFSDESGIKHPSVSTQAAVYFVVNPSTAMFESFGAWCAGQSMMQLDALSSYGAIRIWRVEPYAFCPAEGDGSDGCRPGHVRFQDVPGGLAEGQGGVLDATRCGREFTARVTGLEYLNVDNIAVTYLSVRIEDFDVERAEPRPGKGVTKIVYYNPASNELKDTPWRKTMGVAATSEGQLCPAMRRLPQLGSFLTEGVAIWVNVARFVVRLSVGLPGLVDMWRQGARCPAVARGHTMLETCGAEVLSLDEAFDSISVASSHFWGIMYTVAARIREAGGGGSVQNTVSSVVSGAGMYGEATIVAIPSLRALLRSMRLPVEKAGEAATSVSGVLSRFAVSTGGVAPIGMARYTYNLVAGWLSGLLPVVISGQARGLGGGVIGRQALAVMANEFVDSRGDFDRFVLSGFKRACSGTSLMMGYSNPVATYVRKACEIFPEAIGGVATAFTSMTFVIPFVHCICVDSPGTAYEFESYAMENCYYFAPGMLKGFVLDVIQGVRAGGSQADACRAMVAYAREDMEGALQPMFTTMYLAAEALGPSLDYFVQLIDPEGSGCSRFESNPFATLLMPEPMDFWSACSATEVCRGKCYGEITSLERELELARASSPNGVVQLRNETVRRVVESKMFVDVDRSSYAPFKVLAMVELESCTAVCGGGPSGLTDEFDTGNADLCVAVAGLTDSLELRVQKYCVPRALGLGVREQASEGWTVRGSSEFTSTVLQVFFADTSLGDTLIVLRDNTGSGLGGRDLVTVHPRSIQRDDVAFDAVYGTQAKRDARLAVMTLDEGTEALGGSGEVTGVIAIHVVPGGLSGRPPWVFMRVQTAGGRSVTESGGRDLCFPVLERDLIDTMGQARPRPALCGTKDVMTAIVDEGLAAVLPLSALAESCTLALLPTATGGSVCLLRLSFVAGSTVSTVGTRVCMGTTKGFMAQSGIPAAWGDRGYASFGGESIDAARRAMVTSSGVVHRVARVAAQNCLQLVDAGGGEGTTLRIFASGDSASKSSWLSQSRITLPSPDASHGAVVTVDRVASLEATVTATVTLGCDLYSCAGCVGGRLQGACYAAQRCTLERCIGTPVNQRRPLCNAGMALQKIAESGIAVMAGAWIVLTETYGTIMELALDRDASRNVRITALDEAFYAQVCTLKDLTGSAAALVTSIAGSAALSPGVTSAGASAGLGMHATAQATDRANAETTMLLNGVNAFLYQLLLAPIFAAVAVQKTMVCGGNSLLAVADTGGFSLRIGRASLVGASDLLVGSCLSSTASACADNPGQMGSEECLGQVSQSVLEKISGLASGLMSLVYLEPLVHALDAFFANLEGVISGAQDLAQVADAAHCSMPDYYLNDAVKCSCGDTAVQIPAANMSQGAGEFAHWCSGTLRMVSPFGRDVYVYNPYSYGELVGHPSMQRADAYLLCLSRNTDAGFCGDMEPWVDGLSGQGGVSALAVLQRCRDNYFLKQWDAGAFLLYDVYGEQGVGRPLSAPLSVPPSAVGACLLDAQSRGEPNTGCMQDWLAQDSKKAFRYDTVADAARDASSLNIAACRIFTGPAKNADAEVAAPYRACAAEWDEFECRLPLIAWSGGSSNRLPVANDHVVDTTTEEGRAARAESDYAEVLGEIMPKLRALENFTDENLNVVLFSADGDVLHQAFDCMVLGPFSRVDFWSSAGGQLAVPTWARDASGVGETRLLDTPCSLDKLDGDTMPPFTCGSATRRAMIKNFVRDFINGRKRGPTMVEKLVREKIQELIAAWGDTGQYGCVCESPGDVALHGSNDPRCCRDGDGEGGLDNFLPPSIGNTAFDIINASQIAKEVLEKVPGFMRYAHTEPGNDAFYRHHSKSLAGETALWRWEQDPSAARRASDAGLLWAHGDVLTWGPDEVGAPFRDKKTLWETCTGLVSQNMFNLPMARAGGEPDGEWTLADVESLRLTGQEYDPAADDGDSSAATSPLERYVTSLLRSAYSSSSLFWVHALRHAPSESLLCKRRYDGPGGVGWPAGGGELRFENEQGIPVAGLGSLPGLPMRGYAARPLGGVGSDCFCGWERGASSGMCTLPAPVCSGLGREGSGCVYADADAHAVEAAALEGWQEGWECPEMDLSDAWGVVPPSRTRQWLEQQPGDVTADVALLLTDGRAGLRAGNIGTLAAQARAAIRPDRRVHALSSADGSGGAVSLECLQGVLSRASALGVAARLVDDLFPASRGVQDSQPVAACLRLAIEHARLRVLQMLSGVRDTSVEVGAQETVVARWRARCSSQLDMLQMCKSQSVFQMVPDVEHEYDCPFSISSPPYSERAWYVTSGCLVYKAADDAFYDPCLQGGLCMHEAGESVGVALSAVTAKVPFDPTSIVRDGPIGYWPIRFETARGGEGGKDEELSALAADLDAFDGASRIPRELAPGFVEKLVRGGGVNSPGYGNSPSGKTWGTAEGANSDGQRFCDAIADWWPDDWTKPVGYHVSLPCHHSPHCTPIPGIVSRK